MSQVGLHESIECGVLERFHREHQVAAVNGSATPPPQACACNSCLIHRLTDFHHLRCGSPAREQHRKILRTNHSIMVEITIRRLWIVPH